ncbi:hypothetical protein Tco_1035172 [Tanacetum coccineum]
MQNGIAIHMLTEKKYPLSQEMISKMLKKKLEVDHESSQAFELLRIDQGVGSTSGIRACALRNFDLGVMELENSQNNALAKLPMLKLGEYEMWEIRIKQYFQIQDYALWEVIENGNSWVPIPVTATETGPSTGLKMTVPSTAEEKICKKNDVKARSLLLMALPNEHQLTFDQYVDAQSMFAAIKARFGGNEATKKTQKALLKQQYENFNASSSESLDSIFNRLQKLVSRLAILGVVTPPEDLNVKFLRSLPSEWDTHVVVWMNKPDFDTMGLDDLYNNFKIVEQKVKRSAGANNDDKNLAFLTTSGASSTNNINTVNPEVSTGTTKVNTASTEITPKGFLNPTFMASQDARLSKFEANFKQQQSEMTNKIDTVLKAITDRIAGTLPSDTVKNPKLGTIPVLSARSYPTEDSQCSTHIHSSITAITIPQSSLRIQDKIELTFHRVEKFKSEFDSLNSIGMVPNPPIPISLALKRMMEKLYLMRRSLEVLRKFHWMILGG